MAAFRQDSARKIYQPGEVIYYVLRSDQQPTNPGKVWAGIVVKRLRDMDDQAQAVYYVVMSVDEAYQDYKELVYPEQLVDYEATHFPLYRRLF